MTHHWDEFSKSLAEKSVPRRESLRLLGAALASALLSPLGVRTAWAGPGDACRSFCRCANKAQQRACLAACRACGGDTSGLCGSCGSGYACTDPDFDFANCGACGHWCAEPGPHEEGACILGECVYHCASGAVDCGDGACTPLWSDPDNCGACGNVCPDTAPVCIDGVCSPNPCGGGSVYCPHVPVDPGCTFLEYDSYNCGACGVVCNGPCNNGQCDSGSPPEL